MFQKLTIIIPCYNEEKTIEKVVSEIENVNLPLNLNKEVIIVDDGSGPRTREILKNLEHKHKIIYLPRNFGKGYAVRQGIKEATGDLILIQDADLEYDVNDYPKLLEPMINNGSEIVYGSRFLQFNERSKYYWGVKGLTILLNLLFRAKLTDSATCYKLFRSEHLKNLDLQCQRFEFCPEVTTKLLKKGLKIVEVPINYYPRSVVQGKKIKIKDGLEAMWTIIKYRFIN